MIRTLRTMRMIVERESSDQQCSENNDISHHEENMITNTNTSGNTKNDEQHLQKPLLPPSLPLLLLPSSTITASFINYIASTTVIKSFVNDLLHCVYFR